MVHSQHPQKQQQTQPICQHVHAQQQQQLPIQPMLCSLHRNQQFSPQQISLCPEHLHQMNLQAYAPETIFCKEHHIFNLQSSSKPDAPAGKEPSNKNDAPPPDCLPKPEPSKIKVEPPKCPKNEPPKPPEIKKEPPKCPPPKEECVCVLEPITENKDKLVCYCTVKKTDKRRSKDPSHNDTYVVQNCQNDRFNENHKASTSRQHMHHQHRNHHHDHPKRSRRLHQCPNDSSSSTIDESKGVCTVC